MLHDADPQEPVLSLSKEWTLKALREAGSCLLAEFYGLAEDELRWQPAGEDWSLKEVAAHLRDNEELALAQLRALIGRCDGPLPAWDIEVPFLDRDDQSDDIHQALASFQELRRQTTHLLWGLSEPDWQQAGEHPYRGRVTLAEVARELAQHDLEHLWQVRRIRQQLTEAVSLSSEEE